MLPNVLTLALIGLGCLLALAVMSFGALAVRRSRRNAQTEHFRERWREIQASCAKSDLWPMIVVEADKLVDDALKAAGFKGRTMGERLVAAQRSLSDNDSAWFGHKLRNKIVHEEISRLYKKDVQTALKGLRKVLLDLGVLV